MLLQLIATGLIVALAAVYLLRAGRRALAGSGKSCGSGCGKCATETTGAREGMIPLEQVGPSRKDR
jgi:hypothetical protein